MAGLRRVPLDHRRQVLAVHRQVVQVHQEARVAEPRSRVDLVDDLHGRGCAHQRVQRRLGFVEGLDQQDRADGARRPGREHQVLQRERVLLVRVHAVDTVAVQGVERLAAQRLGELGGHVDVGPEPLRLRAGDRQGAPVRPGQLPGVEVQAREPHARVLDRPLQGVQLGPLGDGRVDPGPPQLDRGEAGRRGGRGTLQEREFREEDRQVDVEALRCGCARFEAWHRLGAPLLSNSVL